MFGLGRVEGNRTPRVLKDLPDSGEGWDIYCAFFARTGFTDAARTEVEAHNAWLVDLATLERDLSASG